MKIVEDRWDRLVIEDRPHLMAALIWSMAAICAYGAVSGDGIDETWKRWLLGVLALGIGALAYAKMPYARITFDRLAGTVERRLAYLDRARTATWPLSSLDHVRYDATWSDHARMIRLVIEIDGEGVVPLQSAYSSDRRRPGEPDIAERVAAWLTEPPSVEET
ncbi:MAG: hypothetical protein AAF713_05680 [Pseudomonadota bacterium]